MKLKNILIFTYILICGISMIYAMYTSNLKF